MTEFPAVHHVVLTVTSLEASREWYQQLLATEPVLDEDVPALPGHHQGFRHTVFWVPGGPLLALHEHAATDQGQVFDEFRPGLDHVGFGCADRNQLEQWQTRLDCSASSTAASPRTPSASACPSAIQTTSPWSSGRPVPRYRANWLFGHPVPPL